MSTESTSSSPQVPPRKLWFGTVAAALCWVGLGIADILITWRECLHREQYGGTSHHPGLLSLNVVVFLALLLTAAIAGVMSYKNWRHLAGQVQLYRAEATGSREYMALIGVFISVTLGIGIIWLGLPLLIISLCVRTR
jgi:hypothetical protein